MIETLLQLVAHGVGLEEDLALGVGQALAALHHLGALVAGRPAGVLLEAAAEVPGEPGLPLLVGHDFCAAGEQAPVHLVPAVGRPGDPVPRVLQQIHPSRVVGTVDREVSDRGAVAVALPLRRPRGSWPVFLDDEGKMLSMGGHWLQATARITPSRSQQEEGLQCLSISFCN